MGEAEKSLNTWTLINVKNKDLFLRRIANIKEEVESFTVTQNDEKIVAYYPIITLNDTSKIKGLFKEGQDLTIITLNNKENFDFFIKNWKTFSVMKGLNFWFVNPFSNTDKKWLLNPYVHSKICDEESLELGLKSIAEGVEMISPDEFLKRSKELEKE